MKDYLEKNNLLRSCREFVRECQVRDYFISIVVLSCLRFEKSSIRQVPSSWCGQNFNQGLKSKSFPMFRKKLKCSGAQITFTWPAWRGGSPRLTSPFINNHNYHHWHHRHCHRHCHHRHHCHHHHHRHHRHHHCHINPTLTQGDWGFTVGHIWQHWGGRIFWGEKSINPIE